MKINKKQQIKKIMCFPRRQLENTLQCFEEVQKKPGKFPMCFPRRQLENTLSYFEEVRKKPGGVFQWQ